MIIVTARVWQKLYIELSITDFLEVIIKYGLQRLNFHLLLFFVIHL